MRRTRTAAPFADVHCSEISADRRRRPRTPAVAPGGEERQIARTKGSVVSAGSDGDRRAKGDRVTPFHDLGDYLALPRVAGLCLSPDGERLPPPSPTLARGPTRPPAPPCAGGPR